MVAVRSDGTVWTWGNNEYGQLGMATNLRAPNVPTQVPGLTGVEAASTYDGHVLARGSGKVWAWGNNVRGQLGNGTSGIRLSPYQLW